MTGRPETAGGRETEMSGLQFRFFGGFEILDGRGQAVAVKPRKARALLAYLALHAGEAQSRDKLGALLWADSAKTQARSSLRQALAKIRSAMPEDAVALLNVDNETVALAADGLCVDAVEFRRLIADGAPDALIEAVALYRGDLLEGFDARAPEFDDWLRAEAEGLRGQALSALSALLSCESAQAVGAQANHLVSRLLALDPLNETAHRALMRLYARQGRHAAAIEQYRLCQDHLRRQLDVAPEAETQALHREIVAQRTSPAAEAMPAPAVDAGKPSIAVLPFVNLGHDPAQDMVADGMTEDLIGLLSMVKPLFVIARNSTWSYRQRTTDVREIGRDLDVRYVLDGTVRAAGGRIRITAQLIDSGTAQQIWAERYDRELSDIFDLQDEVAQGIVGALQPHLLLAEAAFADRKRPADLDAWGCIAKATTKLRDYSRAAIDAAEPLARQAIEIDPDFAAAHGILGNILAWRSYNGFADDIFGCAKTALAHIDRALALDRSDPMVLNAAGTSCVLLGRFLQARPLLQRAYELNPNAAMTCTSLGWVLAITGRAEDGLALVERAMRLSPKDPNAYLFHADRASCLYFAERFDAAIDAAEMALRLHSDYSAPRLILVATLVRLDRLAEARREAEKLRTVAPTAMENVFRARTDGTVWPFLTEAIRVAS